MESKYIVAIDIGLKGAIVVSKDLEVLEIHKMPVQDGAVDFRKLSSLIRDCGPNIHVVFEELHSLFTAGKSQTWSLAYQCGAVEMMCVSLGLSYTKVAPKVWQEEMFWEIPPLRKPNGKTDTKAMAYVAYKKYFPDIDLKKSEDGKIDALLIGEWYRRFAAKTIGGDTEQKILWEEEQIPAEKRDTLKSLGLQQLFVHKTFVHMPGMDYSQIPLIPTSTFFTPDRKYEFYWLFLDDTLRWMTNRGDAEKTYFTWEEGLEFIKKVMTNAN